MFSFIVSVYDYSNLLYPITVCKHGKVMPKNIPCSIVFIILGPLFHHNSRIFLLEIPMSTVTNWAYVYLCGSHDASPVMFAAVLDHGLMVSHWLILWGVSGFPLSMAYATQFKF